MARLPRIVIPDCPHHVTQRGNRRQQTFFTEEDYSSYIDQLARSCKRYHVKIIAYCLMPNHVHLIAIPETEKALSKAIGDTHKIYTEELNYRMKWKGHLWQGRYFSVVMDEDYTEKCIAYVEMNPVRANLCEKPTDYRWSSARANSSGFPDKLIISPRYSSAREPNSESYELIRIQSRTGRPLGSKEFIQRLERETGLDIFPKKSGPKSIRNESVDLPLSF